MLTFKHNGKYGDIIYSLPTIQALGGGILYIPESTPDGVTNMYSSMKSFLEMQPGIHEVRQYPSGLGYGERAPGIHIDYDLDDARNQPMKGVVFTVKRYANAFGVQDKVKIDQPWLTLGALGDVKVADENYTVFNYTGRHVTNERWMIGSAVDWAAIYKNVTGRKVFIGLLNEYEWFCKLVWEKVEYVETRDVFEIAILVESAKAVYCNQSLCLTLAQGFGVPYYLAVKPGKQNCLMRTKNEHLL